MTAYTGPHGPLVDAVTGRQIRYIGPENRLASLVPGARRFWGRMLDILIVLLLDLVALFVSIGVTQGSATGLLVFVIVHLVIVHLVIVFVTGTIAGTAGTVGEHAGGFRSVHRRTGARPGFWRGGLRAILYSCTPLLVLAIFSGDAPTFDSNFMQLDTRSGVARGIPPVPAP